MKTACIIVNYNDADTTTSHVAELTNDERVAEIANMLSGEQITQAAIDNARALIEAAQSTA